MLIDLLLYDNYARDQPVTRQFNVLSSAYIPLIAIGNSRYGKVTPAWHVSYEGTTHHFVLLLWLIRELGSRVKVYLGVIIAFFGECIYLETVIKSWNNKEAICITEFTPHLSYLAYESHFDQSTIPLNSVVYHLAAATLYAIICIVQQKGTWIRFISVSLICMHWRPYSCS